MNNPEPGDICSEPGCGLAAILRDSFDEPWCSLHEDILDPELQEDIFPTD
jgi:hypothetical protein